jgi:two-component system response regulator HydG
MANKKERTLRILAVDDNENALEIIQRTLEDSRFEVTTSDGVQPAVDLLQKGSFDLVITDLKMPKHSGLDLVRFVNENHPRIRIIMVTGYPSIEGAVEAVKTGADAFLPKPFTGDELLDAVVKEAEKIAAQDSLKKANGAKPPFGIIGASKEMKRVYKLIAKAASMKANVLISGESGTGKELAARAIHYGSSRSSAAFVPVNCTAIPENLLESELFGHEKGAFTGATASRAGFFQIADGGTIFLDEIGDASKSMQAKLLRVIQNKEIVRVGSTRVIHVDVRIVAATNKDLKRLVEKNLFREDLFYRLNVIDILLPPLRNRREDLPLLVNHFVANLAKEIGIDPFSFSDRALKAMTGYPWPGNIRELENLIQKMAVVVEDDQVKVSDLPEQMRFTIEGKMGSNCTLAEVERAHIEKVLSGTGGNKTQAAKILGIDRKTLREKVKKYVG